MAARKKAPHKFTTWNLEGLSSAGTQRPAGHLADEVYCPAAGFGVARATCKVRRRSGKRGDCVKMECREYRMDRAPTLFARIKGHLRALGQDLIYLAEHLPKDEEWNRDDEEGNR